MKELEVPGSKQFNAAEFKGASRKVQNTGLGRVSKSLCSISFYPEDDGEPPTILSMLTS